MEELLFWNIEKIMDLVNPTIKMSKSSDSPMGVITMYDTEDEITKKNTATLLQKIITETFKEKVDNPKTGLLNYGAILSLFMLLPILALVYICRYNQKYGL